MKKYKYLLIVLVVLLALLLIGLGIFRVVDLYETYRADMLDYESRHFESIVSTSGRGMGWMISGYTAQMETMVERLEFKQAEEAYFATGDTRDLQELMSRPDILQIGMQCKLMAYDRAGNVLASTDDNYLIPQEDDVWVGDNIILREQDGAYWLVFGKDSEREVRYELAVSMHSLFSSHAYSARIGQNGYLFLMDRDRSFLAFSSDGWTMTYSMDALRSVFPQIDELALEELAESGLSTSERYLVFRYPWERRGGNGETVVTETLVVTYPVAVGNTSLVMGAAVSFQEFDSILTVMLDRVVGMIVLEIAGASLLMFLVAWALLRSRRSALQMAIIKEKADLMEEINRQQQSLQHNERLQQLGVMTSGIAHEFNNLMTPIMGQSLLLLEQLADQEDTPLFDNALDIYEASEKARDILKGMSTMSKNNVNMSFRTLDIIELLRKTMALASMAKDTHVQQELVETAEPVFVSGNDQLLTQAFLNLFINGFQAMGKEGKLRVTMALESRSGMDYIRVEVKDTGPGIPANKLGQIYDPFYTTKGEHGTGLGLVICQKIVETHKGTIAAANHPDGGAVFTVRLPVQSLSLEE